VTGNQPAGPVEHLVGMRLPPVALPSSRGRMVRLDQEPSRWAVLYCHPRIGRPGEPSPGGDATWDAIPGARGCTPQSCGYRDHYAELQGLGAAVYGVSTQSTESQREAAERLRLPFELLSDAAGELRRALHLPIFEVNGEVFLQRLTLLVTGGRIAACIYPVDPPGADAEHVIEWLQGHREI
jgi:peroxiredoxin